MREFSYVASYTTQQVQEGTAFMDHRSFVCVELV